MRKILLVLFFATVASFSSIEALPIYVTNNGSNNATLIDPTTNATIATLTVGTEPVGAAYKIDNSQVYIVNAADLSVSVIDPIANTSVATITIGGVGYIWKVAFTPDGNKAYVTDVGDAYIYVIDALANTLIATITLGTLETNEMAFTSDSSTLFVTGSGDAVVFVVNTVTDVQIATITAFIGGSPIGIAISPVDANGYVTNSTTMGQIAVLNTTSLTLVATITAGDQPRSVEFSPDGLYAYVSSVTGLINVIATGSDTVIATITVVSFLRGFGLTPDGSTIYTVSNAASNPDIVQVINTATLTVLIATITIGNDPEGGIAIANLPTPPPSPPSSGLTISASAKSNIFLSQKELFNIITWTSPDIITITQYRIYRDAAKAELIGTVLAGNPPQFEDHNRMPKTTYTYFIFGEEADGTVVASGSVSVTTN